MLGNWLYDVLLIDCSKFLPEFDDYGGCDDECKNGNGYCHVVCVDVGVEFDFLDVVFLCFQFSYDFSVFVCVVMDEFVIVGGLYLWFRADTEGCVDVWGYDDSCVGLFECFSV